MIMVQQFINRFLSKKSEKESTKFVASQIIADLEEIYADPFGVAECVCSGYGGTIGCGVIDFAGETKLSAKLDRLLAAIHKLNIDELRVLGCFKNEVGKVCVSHNSRPLGLVDTEHMCCKLYILLVRTRGSRRHTQPSPFKAHCHPIKSIGGLGEPPKQIFKSAMQSYQRLKANNTWRLLPRVFTLS